MKALLSRKRLTQLFDIGIAIKALDGLLEVTGGLILSLLSPGQLVWLASMITRGELAEDPSDFFANLFLHTASRVTAHGKLVALVFLFSHGFIKIVLAWELYRGKLRAYPLTMAVLSLFIVYQLVEIVRGHSLLLIALTALDVIIILLAWHEYRLRKQASESVPDCGGKSAWRGWRCCPYTFRILRALSSEWSYPVCYAASLRTRSSNQSRLRDLWREAQRAGDGKTYGDALGRAREGEERERRRFPPPRGCR